MKIEEKIAVLKLAGFKVQQDSADLWEWYLSRENSPDGQSRLGKDSYADEETAAMQVKSSTMTRRSTEKKE